MLLTLPTFAFLNALAALVSSIFFLVSNILKICECSDSILSPNIHVTSEKWDGGHTYITVTFYDYNTNQSVAVIKSSGIGMTISHDQNIALNAIRKKINELFK